ncbi:hypothetical protein KUG47_11970 [Falsochrobactrum sp. TDYN1]|uniref:Uncharacterized protein n=1 Tax=Falsochrobactrum tianjinense TaxID=2706015 RepID=A0A949UTV1_9HYPH|nr:hypothetical protein [Falsochrobactrum sp. TDYN1]MBV2144210.1 hypothetical protein [Falsochrobactrum sp. TDYN1]
MEIAELLKKSVEENERRMTSEFRQQIKDFELFSQQLEDAGVKANKIEYDIPLMGRITAYAV